MKDFWIGGVIGIITAVTFGLLGLDEQLMLGIIAFINAMQSGGWYLLESWAKV